MELINGRPDCTGRLDKEIRVYDLLDALGISYQQVDHEAAMTMEACLAIDEALGTAMCKNLLLCNRQCTQFYLLLIPGDKPFKTSVLSKQIGSARLSFASGEYMEQFLDITPGSLSVMSRCWWTRRFCPPIASVSTPVSTLPVWPFPPLTWWSGSSQPWAIP